MDKYKMPAVKVGEAVLWAHDKHRMADSAAAIVTKVGSEAIGLVFFAPDSSRGNVRDGVRFIGDPANVRTESDAGVFDFGPDRKRMDELQARLLIVERAVTVTDDDGK